MILFKKDFFLYCLMIGIVFLSSFRGPSLEFALDYSVPGYIQTVFNLSIPITVVLMAISIWIFFNNGNSGNTKGHASLTAFFLFQIILLVTEYVLQSDLQDFLTRIVFCILTYVYFLKVVSSLPLYEELGFSVLKAFYWGTFLFIVVNLLVHFGGMGIVTWKGRLFGLTAHPNFLGVASAAETVFSFSLLMLNGSYKKKIIYFIGFVAGLVACLLTMSRTGLVGITAGVLVILFTKMRNSSFKPVFFLMMLLLLLVLVGNLTLQSLDYAERGNTREETWKELYEDVARLPIFGQGRTGASSNGYMFVIVASGILGAIFFYKSLLDTIVTGFSHFFNPIRKVRLIYMSVLALILITSIFEGYFLDTVSIPAFTYWMLLATIKQVK